MRLGVYYFSGCGNTAWVAQKTIETLTDIGHEVVLLHSFEEELPAELPRTDVDIFLAPIYFGGIPSFVVDKIKKLPITGDKKALFWAVAGKFSGIGRRFGTFVLKDRGYDVLTTHTILMPDTFLPLKISQISDDEKRQVYKRAEQQIKDGLETLTHLKAYRAENVITATLSCLMYFPYLYYIRFVLANCFVSTSSCVHCGKCERNCPCKVISLPNGRPKWHKGCTGCFRCVNTCPVAAIDISWWGVGFGVVGALAALMWASSNLAFLGAVLSLVVKWVAFFAGFWAGTWLFQKIYPFLPVDKGLMMKGKKRSFIADEEK